MKWTNSALVFVVAILSISYVYSSYKNSQLSGKIKKQELEVCGKRGGIDCSVIKDYHDECFDSSYRAELKIRSFHSDEYQACLRNKMKKD